MLGDPRVGATLGGDPPAGEVVDQIARCARTAPRTGSAGTRASTARPARSSRAAGPARAHVAGARRSRSAGPWCPSAGARARDRARAASVDLAVRPARARRRRRLHAPRQPGVAPRDGEARLAFERDTVYKTACRTCSTGSAGPPARGRRRPPSCRGGRRGAARRRGRRP